MISAENDKSPHGIAERYLSLLGEMASQVDSTVVPEELDEIAQQLIGRTATIATVDGSRSIQHAKHRYVIASGVMWWERVRSTNHAKGTVASAGFDKAGEPTLTIKRNSLLSGPHHFSVHPVDTTGNPIVSISVRD